MSNDRSRGVSQREILPDPDIPAPGLTTYDAKDPDTSYPPIVPLRPPEGAPDVLLELIDTVGYGASSAFGGPCQTPTFEALAAAGLKYTRFHTTALCSPTRSALLTGRNHLIKPEDRVKLAMGIQWAHRNVLHRRGYCLPDAGRCCSGRRRLGSRAAGAGREKALCVSSPDALTTIEKPPRSISRPSPGRSTKATVRPSTACRIHRPIAFRRDRIGHQRGDQRIGARLCAGMVRSRGRRERIFATRGMTREARWRFCAAGLVRT